MTWQARRDADPLPFTSENREIKPDARDVRPSSPGETRTGPDPLPGGGALIAQSAAGIDDAESGRVIYQSGCHMGSPVVSTAISWAGSASRSMQRVRRTA